MIPAVKRDSFFGSAYVGCFALYGLPFVWLLWLFAKGHVWSQVGLAVLVGVAIYYYVRSWNRTPFDQARTTWEMAEKARYEDTLLRRRESLNTLGATQFEEAITRLYWELGWDAVRTPPSNDGGWDVDIRSGNMRFLVECKKFALDKKVGRPVLQKLHSAVVTEGASGGILVTTAGFSQPAREFAAQHKIQLVGDRELAEMLSRAYPDELGLEVYGLCRACGATAAFSPNTKEGPLWRFCEQGHFVKHPFVWSGHWPVIQAEKELKRTGKWKGG